MVWFVVRCERSEKSIVAGFHNEDASSRTAPLKVFRLIAKTAEVLVGGNYTLEFTRETRNRTVTRDEYSPRKCGSRAEISVCFQHPNGLGTTLTICSWKWQSQSWRTRFQNGWMGVSTKTLSWFRLEQRRLKPEHLVLQNEEKQISKCFHKFKHINMLSSIQNLSDLVHSKENDTKTSTTKSNIQNCHKHSNIMKMTQVSFSVWATTSNLKLSN